MGAKENKLKIVDDTDEKKIQRAWLYLENADSLLHSRMNALVLCQAFLAIAYVQIISASTFNERAYLPIAGLVIVGIGFFVTKTVLGSIIKLQQGGDAMKKYLVNDSVYDDYLDAVRDGGPRKWLTSYTAVVPTFFEWFWVILFFHITYATAVGYWGLFAPMNFVEVSQ